MSLGECEFCGLKMGPTSGIPRNQRLQHHILRKCYKYTHSTSVAPAIPTTPSPMQSSSSSSSSELSIAGASSTQSRKPRPINCHKKKGECNHVIAFGDHYNKKAWNQYTEYVNSQKALHAVPTE